MAYPARRLFSWAIVLGGIAIAAWNGLPNPLAPFPGKSVNRGSWRLYYRGDLSADQVNRYCQVLETTTQGINEAWLYPTDASWTAVLFLETTRDVENVEAQRGKLEDELMHITGYVRPEIGFRKGHPERAKTWIM